jgi:folate-binding protein YgfZ
MNLGVDHTRQDMQPACVKDFRCGHPGECANRHNAAVSDANIGFNDTVGGSSNAAAEEEIEGFGHAAEEYAAPSTLATARQRITSRSMPIARLDDRAVLAISGADAKAFLQGLITNDIEQVAPHHAIYAALLTPQGKVLFDFLIASDEEDYLLDCASDAREGLMKRLAMYRLRSKVQIAPRDDLAVVAAWGQGLEVESLEEHGFRDPRHPALGARAITLRDASSPHRDDYLAHRLALGVPEAIDFGSDKTFALDADLDELHAIAFDKGCYVGQELTARMKHRGTARKRLIIVSAAGTLPAPGSAIRGTGIDIGEITSSYGNIGFALVRLDRLADATSLTAGDSMPVSLTKPPWLSA